MKLRNILLALASPVFLIIHLNAMEPEAFPANQLQNIPGWITKLIDADVTTIKSAEVFSKALCCLTQNDKDSAQLIGNLLFVREQAMEAFKIEKLLVGGAYLEDRYLDVSLYWLLEQEETLLAQLNPGIQKLLNKLDEYLEAWTDGGGGFASFLALQHARKELAQRNFDYLESLDLLFKTIKDLDLKQIPILKVCINLLPTEKDSHNDNVKKWVVALLDRLLQSGPWLLVFLREMLEGENEENVRASKKTFLLDTQCLSADSILAIKKNYNTISSRVTSIVTPNKETFNEATSMAQKAMDFVDSSSSKFTEKYVPDIKKTLGDFQKIAKAWIHYSDILKNFLNFYKQQEICWKGVNIFNFVSQWDSSMKGLRDAYVLIFQNIKKAQGVTEFKILPFKDNRECLRPGYEVMAEMLKNHKYVSRVNFLRKEIFSHPFTCSSIFPFHTLLTTIDKQLCNRALEVLTLHRKFIDNCQKMFNRKKGYQQKCEELPCLMQQYFEQRDAYQKNHKTLDAELIQLLALKWWHLLDVLGFVTKYESVMIAYVLPQDKKNGIRVFLPQTDLTIADAPESFPFCMLAPLIDFYSGELRDRIKCLNKKNIQVQPLQSAAQSKNKPQQPKQHVNQNKNKLEQKIEQKSLEDSSSNRLVDNEFMPSPTPETIVMPEALTEIKNIELGNKQIEYPEKKPAGSSNIYQRIVKSTRAFISPDVIFSYDQSQKDTYSDDTIIHQGPSFYLRYDMGIVVHPCQNGQNTTGNRAYTQTLRERKNQNFNVGKCDKFHQFSSKVDDFLPQGYFITIDTQDTDAVNLSLAHPVNLVNQDHYAVLIPGKIITFHPKHLSPLQKSLALNPELMSIQDEPGFFCGAFVYIFDAADKCIHRCFHEFVQSADKHKRSNF